MSLKWYFYWRSSAWGLRHRHQNHIRSNAGRGFWSLIDINVFPTYECAFDAFCKMLKQTASSDIQTLAWPPREHQVVLGAGKNRSDPALGRTRLLRFVQFLHNAACVPLMWRWCVSSAQLSPFCWNLFFFRSVFITRNNLQRAKTTAWSSNYTNSQLYQKWPHTGSAVWHVMFLRPLG